MQDLQVMLEAEFDWVFRDRIQEGILYLCSPNYVVDELVVALHSLPVVEHLVLQPPGRRTSCAESLNSYVGCERFLCTLVPLVVNL